MARVSVDDAAFGDTRYGLLARALGLADADHARGKMLLVWRQCTAEKRYVLPLGDVIELLGVSGPDALVEARLGERVSDGIRIKGTRGRIEWLEKLRKNGRKGGRPPGSKTKTKRKPSGSSEPNPLALASALAPVLDQERGNVSGKPDAAPLPIAVACCEALNAATGTHYRPESLAIAKLARNLTKTGATPDQVRVVVADRVAAWSSDAKMAPFLRPATILAVENFGKYLDDIEAGATRRAPAAPTAAPRRLL